MKDHTEPKSLQEASALLRNMALEQDDAKTQTSTPQPEHTEIPGDNDEQLPLYTKAGSDIWERLQELAATVSAEDSIALPILAYPAISKLATLEEGESLRRRRRIVSTFFDEIAKADVEMITALLHMRLVSTETTNEAGKTPLLAAVDAGNSSSVKALLDAGAAVNAYGITEIVTTVRRRKAEAREHNIIRTPLQFAAELGNLALVKLLMERGADDSLIAPDGQLALRLAASNGHREIVNFLPRRRGGGFKRWKAKHKTAMRRCEKAVHGIYEFGKFFVWDVPKFFVWSIPKYLFVLPVVESFKWLRAHGAEIPSMVADWMRQVGKALKRFPASLWREIKTIPGLINDLARGIGVIIMACGIYLWRIIKAIPAAIKTTLLWIWSGISKMAHAIGAVFARLFSFTHTLVAGIIGFFQRITLADIGRAFVACLRAIFIDLPKKLWDWTCSFGQASLKALKALFGGIGECIWFMVRGMGEIILYVPKKLGQIVAACGSSVRSGGKEVMVWFDPKRV